MMISQLKKRMDLFGWTINDKDILKGIDDEIYEKFRKYMESSIVGYKGMRTVVDEIDNSI